MLVIDRMGEWTPTLRRGPSSYWFNGKSPFVYPIIHSLLPGRAEQLCADSPLSLHTLGERRALCASFSLNIPKVEPRALHTTHRCAACSAVTTPGSGWMTKVYPGRCTRCIYREVYTHHGIPGVHSGDNLSYPRVYIAGITSHTHGCNRVYLSNPRV